VTARRRRLPQTRPPRGAWLAFLALAIQVLLPFFLAVEIARANEPGSTVVICSALGAGAHHESNPSGSDRHGSIGSCPICTALAAGHGFTAPPAPPQPLPVVGASVDLAATDAALVAPVAISFYQSRGPPSVA
jgi:hypothetical protein